MVRLIAILLTVLTGFAGLVYEVAWQKYLATLLGSHGEATAAVLAIFLGGLSCGYALFGWATRRVLERARQSGRRPRLLSFYARVEAGIGVYALLFPILFGFAQKISLLGPLNHDALGFAFDVGLSALLIGPPAVLMGGTIPILTLALAGDIDRATRVHAWIYGANTLGAFAGALAGGFWLIPLLGLDGVVWTMAGLNLAAALAFAVLEGRATSVAPDPETSSAVEPVPRIAAWSGIALLAGFAMMALQTTFNRVGALALGSSHFTFAMVVAVFVFSLALGSFAVSALPRIPRALVVGSQWVLVCLLFPLYFWVADVGYWAHVIRVRVGGLSAEFSEYQLAIFGATLALLVIPIGLSGALLPLLFHQLRREVRNLGAVAGRLYAWNTVGSLLGALLGGYLLLIWLDLHHVFRIAMACLAVAASILSVLVLDRIPRVVPALVLLPMLVAIALLPAWPVERLTPGTFRSREAIPRTFLGVDGFFEDRAIGDFIFYDDDPTSSVSVVVPFQEPENIALHVNGKPEGALKGDYPTMALAALIPALIAENHERGFVIGLGTGVTAGELATLEGTRKVSVAEISRAVIAANPLFASGNLGASTHPKIEFIRGDAYRTLLRSTERYDVIVSEPSNPWVAGVEMLYTREFLEAARSRLAPGGVYGQWFHVYETDREVVNLILRTYTSVFPHVSVWFMGGSDLLLLGMDQSDRALDVRALEARFGQPDFASAFGRVKIDRFPQLLAHELIPLGTLHAEPLEGSIHTVRRPLLSDLAARAFFVGSQVPRVGPFMSANHQKVSVMNSLLRRYAGGDEVLPDEIFEIFAREVCRFQRVRDCSAINARWSVDYPESELRRDTLSSLRKAARSRSPSLSSPRLKRLHALYSGRVIPGEDAAPAHVEARRATELFLYHYHHVVPFDRRVLEELWGDCNGEECEAERAQFEEVLWGLDESDSQ
ncbi:MAG: fused MFS/spermidine synthase [Deltaproteobacteria bacterium]|nr:fused MFS/spermidine synthase [Deltaproteobacteria bacterium]